MGFWTLSDNTDLLIKAPHKDRRWWQVGGWRRRIPLRRRRIFVTLEVVAPSGLGEIASREMTFGICSEERGWFCGVLEGEVTEVRSHMGASKGKWSKCNCCDIWDKVSMLLAKYETLAFYVMLRHCKQWLPFLGKRWNRWIIIYFLLVL